MKILHVNDYAVGLGGGAEVVMGRTVDGLRLRGHTVDMFTSADLADAGRTPWRYLDNAIARRALSARLKAFRPDVVHLHNYYHVLSPGILVELASFKRQHSMRVVMTAHDYHLVCPNSGGNWFRAHSPAFLRVNPVRLPSLTYLFTRRWDHRGLAYAWLKLIQHIWSYRCRKLHGAIDALICPSRFLEAMLRPLGLPTHCVANPTPPLQRFAGVKSDQLHLVFVGRVVPEKGLLQYLRILPVGFAGIMTVVGDGEDLEACRRVCLERGLADRITFLGQLPHAQTLERVGEAHVLVLPSVLFENYPMALVEALASRTNLLTSALGGMKEMVETSSVGFLYDPESADSLDAALRRIEVEFHAGTLNRFDVSTFLQERDEEAYFSQLECIYAADHRSHYAPRDVSHGRAA